MNFRNIMVCHLLLFESFLIAGCGLAEKVYTWERNSEPKGVFTVQLKINEKHNVTLLETFDANKKELSGSTIRDYFKGCTYFDESNWKCFDPHGNELIEMKDGELTHVYWGELRKFKSGWKLDL